MGGIVNGGSILDRHRKAKTMDWGVIGDRPHAMNRKGGNFYQITLGDFLYFIPNLHVAPPVCYIIKFIGRMTMGVNLTTTTDLKFTDQLKMSTRSFFEH